MNNVFKPHLTVASIVEHENKFLMVTESIKGQIVINQPAGHVDDNESIIDACVRETLEETCYEVKPYALVGIYLFKAQADLVFLRVCLAAKFSQKMANAKLDAQIISAEWLNYEQIAKAPNLRNQMVLACLNDYLQGNLHDLSLIKPLMGY